MLVIKETYVNNTKGYRFGETGFYKPCTEDKGELFKRMQQACGRCISKVYLDAPDGTAIPVGWAFEKKRKYAGSDETYLQHTWVQYKEVDAEWWER